MQNLQISQRMQKGKKAENTTQAKNTRDSNLSRMPGMDETQRLQIKPKKQNVDETGRTEMCKYERMHRMQRMHREKT